MAKVVRSWESNFLQTEAVSDSREFEVNILECHRSSHECPIYKYRWGERKSHDSQVFIFLHTALLVEAQYQQVITHNPEQTHFMLPDVFLSTFGLYLVMNQNKIVLLMSPLTVESIANTYILVVYL